MVAALANLSEKVIAGVRARAGNPDYLPTDGRPALGDSPRLLAVKGATERHVGKLEQVYSTLGVCYLKEEKI